MKKTLVFWGGGAIVESVWTKSPMPSHWYRKSLQLFFASKKTRRRKFRRDFGFKTAPVVQNMFFAKKKNCTPSVATGLGLRMISGEPGRAVGTHAHIRAILVAASGITALTNSRGPPTRRPGVLQQGGLSEGGIPIQGAVKIAWHRAEEWHSL